MRLDTLRDYVNHVINKEQLGEPQSPKSYNTLLKVVNIEKFVDEYKEWLKTKDPNSPVIRFKKMKGDTQIVNGVLALPEDYRYFISLLEDNEVYKVVNIVSDEKLNDYRFGMLENTETPVGAIYPTEIKVYPKGTHNAELTYFRVPAEPYYDFCIDENDNEIYLPVGSQIRLVNNVLNVYSAQNVLLYQNVTKEGITAPYTSLSVELDWDETEHLGIANLILKYLGLNIRDQYVHQVSTMEAAK